MKTRRQDADDCDRAALVGGRDLRREAADPFLDPLGGDEDVHGGSFWFPGVDSRTATGGATRAGFLRIDGYNPIDVPLG
jgi:hypothetical protein